METIRSSNGFNMRVDVSGLQSALLRLAWELEKLTITDDSLRSRIVILASEAREAVFVSDEVIKDNPVLGLQTAVATTSVDCVGVPEFGANAQTAQG